MGRPMGTRFSFCNYQTGISPGTRTETGDGDPRARRIYETIGTYLGYAIAHFTDFYELENVLILGRVTSGLGGDIIIAGAKAVLKAEFPELTAKIAFHIPDEKDKRHGQAVAAASLPAIQRK